MYSKVKHQDHLILLIHTYETDIDTRGVTEVVLHVWWMGGVPSDSFCSLVPGTIFLFSTKPPAGCSLDLFEKQLIQDLSENGEKIQFKICKRKVTEKEMRVHDICVLCGKHGCP